MLDARPAASGDCSNISSLRDTLTFQNHDNVTFSDFCFETGAALLPLLMVTQHYQLHLKLLVQQAFLDQELLNTFHLVRK